MGGGRHDGSVSSGWVCVRGRGRGERRRSAAHGVGAEYNKECTLQGDNHERFPFAGAPAGVGLLGEIGNVDAEHTRNPNEKGTG